VNPETPMMNIMGMPWTGEGHLYDHMFGRPGVRPGKCSRGTLQLRMFFNRTHLGRARPGSLCLQNPIVRYMVRGSFIRQEVVRFDILYTFAFTNANAHHKKTCDIARE
jgi:hypothetical protein